MASKVLSTPNARLFATETSTDTLHPVQQPRTVKDYQKSNIFSPVPAAVATQAANNGNDSGSETSSNEGDRQPAQRVYAPSTPVSAPIKNRVPPGGYSSKFW